MGQVDQAWNIKVLALHYLVVHAMRNILFNELYNLF